MKFFMSLFTGFAAGIGVYYSSGNLDFQLATITWYIVFLGVSNFYNAARK